MTVPQRDASAEESADGGLARLGRLSPSRCGRQMRRGERERQLLETKLGPWLVAEVEHVGSTAVPGLAAKPILDLQAAVEDLRCASSFASTPRVANRP